MKNSKYYTVHYTSSSSIRHSSCSNVTTTDEATRAVMGYITAAVKSTANAIGKGKKKTLTTVTFATLTPQARLVSTAATVAPAKTATVASQKVLVYLVELWLQLWCN